MSYPEGAGFMRSSRWLLCLWPGLPRLWQLGAFSGLTVAVAFALLIDALLLATWVWTELLPKAIVAGGWGIAAVIWGAAAYRNLRWPTAPPGSEPPAGGAALFAVAQVAYLRGNWLEAEMLFRRLLAADRGDADALLMLASLHRHTGRPAEARHVLGQLERLEAAEKWAPEIQHERRLLARAGPPRQKGAAGTAAPLRTAA